MANIAREAVSNALRHANARRVEIALRSDAETVCLEISDDGAGFDPEAQPPPGIGIKSMTSRTRELGGTLDIRSRLGSGTRVLLRIPTSRV